MHANTHHGIDRTSRIRVLVVDDHPIFRQGLLHMLDAEEDVEAAGEAASLEGALGWLSANRADVVLLDNNMPGMTGVEGLSRLHQVQDDLQVIILTVCDDDDVLLAAIQGGACAYILKDASPGRLIDAVRAAANGECRVSQRLVGGLFRRLNGEHKNVPPLTRGKHQTTTDDASMIRSLIPRDQQLLTLLAEGLSNKEIGQRMNLSPHTIRNQLHRLQQKFGARNRVQLAMMVQTGTGEPDNDTSSPA